MSTQVLIARSAREVAAYAADPERAPEWYRNIERVEWRTPPPLHVGSRLAFVARFLGRRMAYTYEVAEFVPGRRLVMRTVPGEGPFAMETTYTWEAVAQRTTRMTLRNRGVPTGFSRALVPFVASAMRSANRKDLAALKARLERTLP